MAYSRRYTLAEVKGFLQIYRANHAVQGIGPGHHIQRAGAGAHAHIHGGANLLAMQARVNTPGEPRSTGTYWNEDDQAAATLELLNSMAGQIALRRLDIGEGRAPMEGPLTPQRYRMSEAHDRSDRPGQAGHLGRNAATRVGQGAVHTVLYATRGFVLAVPGVAGQLQIQTSYPIG